MSLTKQDYISTIHECYPGQKITMTTLIKTIISKYGTGNSMTETMLDNILNTLLGEGKDFIKNGNLGPNGSFPINTNGGGLSYCHPGMYSIFTMIEGCRQLWGEGGERKLKKNINNVLCLGTGGVLSSAATTILSKEAK